MSRSSDSSPKVWGNFPEYWQNMIEHSVSFLHDFHFAHYYAGTNWVGYSEDKIHKKNVLFREFLDTVMNEDIPLLDYHED